MNFPELYGTCAEVLQQYLTKTELVLLKFTCKTLFAIIKNLKLSIKYLCKNRWYNLILFAIDYFCITNITEKCYYAALAGNLVIVQECMKSPKWWKSGNQFALERAGKSGDLELIKWLLQRDSTIVQTIAIGAAGYNHFHIIRYLLD